MPRITRDRARAAKETALRRFRKLDVVVGVGITRIGGEYAVKINLSEPVRPGSLPPEIDGVPVRVEVIGTVRAR